MAAVRGVMASAIAEGSIHRVSGSTSTKHGAAPVCRMACAVAGAVRAVVMTSSPDETPAARSASASASVPLATPTQCSTPQKEANSVSNASTFGPRTYDLLPSTPEIAVSISDRNRAILRNGAAFCRRIMPGACASDQVRLRGLKIPGVLEMSRRADHQDRSRREVAEDDIDTGPGPDGSGLVLRV